MAATSRLAGDWCPLLRVSRSRKHARSRADDVIAFNFHGYLLAPADANGRQQTKLHPNTHVVQLVAHIQLHTTCICASFWRRLRTDRWILVLSLHNSSHTASCLAHACTLTLVCCTVTAPRQRTAARRTSWWRRAWTGVRRLGTALSSEAIWWSLTTSKGSALPALFICF